MAARRIFHPYTFMGRTVLIGYAANEHIHKNVPGVLSQINSRLSSHKINIASQYLKTNDSIGYVVLDVNKNLSKEALELLKEIKETIKVRLVY